MKSWLIKALSGMSRACLFQAQIQLKEIVEKLTNATSLQELSSSKMEGAKNAYRIRFGNYRIGVYLEESQIVLSRVLDRKDIYKYFPKMR